MTGIRKDRKADALLVIVESGAENVVRFYGRDPAKLKRSASRILRWRRTRINFVAAVFVEAHGQKQPPGDRERVGGSLGIELPAGSQRGVL